MHGTGPANGFSELGSAHIDAQQLNAPDADRATHEQFHVEFKTDLDLTRLSSGEFDTNALVCRLIEHGRQTVLRLGANDRAAAVFTRLHAHFAATA